MPGVGAVFVGQGTNFDVSAGSCRKVSPRFQDGEVCRIGKASQKKGRAAELELAHILQGRGYDIDPGRAQSYGEVPDVSGLPGIHMEVKRVERLNVSEAMKQATRDAERFHDGAPAVFHRRSREPWLVTMNLEDWLDLFCKK